MYALYLNDLLSFSPVHYKISVMHLLIRLSWYALWPSALLQASERYDKMNPLQKALHEAVNTEQPSELRMCYMIIAGSIDCYKCSKQYSWHRDWTSMVCTYPIP